MEQVSFNEDSGTGVYSVTLPQVHKFDTAAVSKAVGKFKLERVDLRIAGEVARDDKGLWLTTKSGVKLLLANRPKKDDKDSPPDIVAKIDEGLKAGKTTFEVSGEAKAPKDPKEATTVQLETAAVVEKKKDEK